MSPVVPPLWALRAGSGKPSHLPLEVLPLQFHLLTVGMLIKPEAQVPRGGPLCAPPAA